jgi:hypothetical protein
MSEECEAEQQEVATDIPGVAELRNAAGALQSLRLKGRCPTMNKKKQGPLKMEIKRHASSEVRFAIEALEQPGKQREAQQHIQQAKRDLIYLSRFEIRNEKNWQGMQNAMIDLIEAEKKVAPPRRRRAGHPAPQPVSDETRAAAARAVGEMSRVGSFNEMLQGQDAENKIVPARKRVGTLAQG